MSGEQKSLRELAYRECAAICRSLISTDTDWDHSYWDQACERCAGFIEDALARQIYKAEAEPTSRVEVNVLNLLARIHRDGGHYVAEHGLDKALEDAEGIVIARTAALDEIAALTTATPGPWRWLDDYRQLVGSTSKDNDVLARSDSGDLYVPHWETGYANARLIAAAPDLLDALQELTLRCDGAEGVREDGSNIQTHRAHAAIAKAFGQST